MSVRRRDRAVGVAFVIMGAWVIALASSTDMTGGTAAHRVWGSWRWRPSSSGQLFPIVMNPAEVINAERERLGVEAAFALDDGTISAAYGTLGTGMHEGLPGHGFVLIDGDGVQRWYGNYPSMWLAPQELLEIALDKL